jgi:hypothetical protein
MPQLKRCGILRSAYKRGQDEKCFTLKPATERIA